MLLSSIVAPLALVAGVSGQTALESYGPAARASAVCLGVLRLSHSAYLARISDALIVRPAKIALILGGAFVVQRLLRRAITRFVQGIEGEAVHRRLGAIRERTPQRLLAAKESSDSRRVQRAETIGALLRSGASGAIWSVAVLMVMAELGLNLGPLLAGAGIVGIAIGFGAQNLVKDFVSGVFMLVEDQYGVGDVIEVGAATGTVEGLSLRTTRLRDDHGTLWHVPNGQINRVGNKSQQWGRAVLDVAVAYQTDIDHATGVIQRTAETMRADPASVPSSSNRPRCGASKTSEPTASPSGWWSRRSPTRSSP